MEDSKILWLRSSVLHRSWLLHTSSHFALNSRATISTLEMSWHISPALRRLLWQVFMACGTEGQLWSLPMPKAAHDNVVSY